MPVVIEAPMKKLKFRARPPAEQLQHGAYERKPMMRADVVLLGLVFAIPVILEITL